MKDREKYLERHRRYNASEKGRERAWRWYVAMPIEKRVPRALKDRRYKAVARMAKREHPSQSSC